MQKVISFFIRLEIIFEVLGDLIHQVETVAAGYIVPGDGVGEVVYGDIQVYALLNKAEAVLPHHGVVDGTLADEQLALEVLGLVDEGSGCKALGVGLGLSM